MPTYNVNLTPAYGRDYKTEQAVLKDWVKGEDFYIADIGNPYNGMYTSIRDWRGKAVRIRFSKLEDFTIIRDDKILTARDDHRDKGDTNQ